MRNIDGMHTCMCGLCVPQVFLAHFEVKSSSSQVQVKVSKDKVPVQQWQVLMANH